jgi:tRNA-dihydrouridine synthase A
VLNGGLATLEQAEAELEARDGLALDGVMLGRAAYHEPALLGRVDGLFFGEGPDIEPAGAVAAYLPYVAARLNEGVPLSAMTRHMLGLFHARPGARTWRRILTVESIRPGAGVEVIARALEAVTRPQQAEAA